MGLLDRLKKKTTTPKATSKRGEGEHAHDHDHADEHAEETAPSAATTAAMTARPTSPSSRAHRVLRQPLVSEKAAIAEHRGSYTFVVAAEANKTTVKQAVKDLYGIMPTRVRIVNVSGKPVRFGRSIGRRSDWKKAIVTLPKGKSIQVHEGV